MKAGCEGPDHDFRAGDCARSGGGMKENNISGMPVMNGSGLAGIVTSRDVRFESNLDAAIDTIMTPKDRLVTVKEDFNLAEVKALLHRHRIENPRGE